MSTESALPVLDIEGMPPRALEELRRILAEHPEFCGNTQHSRNLARRWKFNSFTESGADVAKKPDIQEVFKN